MHLIDWVILIIIMVLWAGYMGLPLEEVEADCYDLNPPHKIHPGIQND